MAQRPERIAARYPRRPHPVRSLEGHESMSKQSKPTEGEALRRAVASLRLIEREVLFLSAAEGLGNDTIAVRLGIPPDAVERHLANALNRLDRLLERQERPWWRIW